MLTGCRRNEILCLRWDDLNFDTGEMRLPDSKTGARTVPMASAAADVLKGLPRTPDSPWVFPGKKKGTRLVNLNDSWDRVRRRAGLDGVRLHDLRHTSAGYQQFPAPISVSITHNTLLPMSFFSSVQAACIHSRILRKQYATGFASLAVTSR